MKKFFRYQNNLTCCRGDMMQNCYAAHNRRIEQRRLKKLSAVKTRKEAEAYIAGIRQKLRDSFGPMPDAVPLSVQSCGYAATNKLRIEKLIIETRPGFFVPALFYRRKDAAGKIPGILFLDGHSTRGKADQGSEQAFPQALALMGFGVLIPDPYGQGERREFDGGIEHNYFGLRLGLFGDFFGAWRLHDALCCVEYMTLRPDLDHKHLGVMGGSGGGTLTAYVHAFSEKITMAAPACSITAFMSNFQNQICGDCEQNPPYFRELGLDEGDFILAHAPRPVLLGVQKDDFFDCRGSRKVYEEVRKIYALWGAEKEIVFHLGEGGHQFTEFQKKGICEFFASHAGLKTKYSSKGIEFLPEETLQCTPGNRVTLLPNAVNSTDRFRKLYQEIRKKHRKPALISVRQGLKKWLNWKEVAVPEYHSCIQQYLEVDSLHASRFNLIPEPGIEIGLKKIGTSVESSLKCSPEIDLVISDLDPVRSAIRSSLVPVSPERNLFALEIRDTGETLPAPENSDLISCVKYAHAAHGMMLGKNQLAGEVSDIVSALKLLKEHGLQKAVIHADGESCVAAAIASIFSPVPAELKLSKLPKSFEKFLSDTKQIYSDAFLVKMHGFLQYMDLNDLFQVTQNR